MRRSSAGARACRVGAAAAVSLAACALAPDARAFCRTTTVAVAPDFQPSPTQCWTEGLPLWWRNACVGYSIQRSASRQISYDDASRVIAAAFLKWTGTACPTDGMGASRVSVDVHDEGAVDCSLVQYNSDQPNQHIIVFRDDAWPHNDANNTLALTTVVFDPKSGEIYDADMEINTAQQRLTVNDPIPADGYDLASIVTHETGHFLGMAHSGDAHATMFAHYSQGTTTLRNLSQDDIAGICTIYPPDGTRTVDKTVSPTSRIAGTPCDPTPRHGFGTQCGTAPKKAGCAVAGGLGSGGSGDAPNGGAPALALAALAASVGAARLHTRRRTGTKKRSP
jgi:hypothetical protein